MASIFQGAGRHICLQYKQKEKQAELKKTVSITDQIKSLEADIFKRSQSGDIEQAIVSKFDGK